MAAHLLPQQPRGPRATPRTRLNNFLSFLFSVQKKECVRGVALAPGAPSPLHQPLSPATRLVSLQEGAVSPLGVTLLVGHTTVCPNLVANISATLAHGCGVMFLLWWPWSQSRHSKDASVQFLVRKYNSEGRGFCKWEWPLTLHVGADQSALHALLGCRSCNRRVLIGTNGIKRMMRSSAPL